MVRLFTAVSLGATLAAAARCGKYGKQPTATVEDYGVVVGTTTVLPSSSSTVNKFLGIPYAAKPTRFELPQPPEPLQSAYNASEYKPACMQTYIYPNSTREYWADFISGGTQPEESEDCLNLNVFAPASANSTSGKPVLVWIYGGSWQTGSDSNPVYDGSNFAANQDVVIVTLNYRLNVFGFPGSPEIQTTQHNLGFYDQRLALDWVRRNIAAFGGDPDKVTLFGQSAGAKSVDALITDAPDPLPFRAAIMESGQITYILSVTNATTAWEELAQAVGCAGDDELECMRNISATTLKEAAEDQLISLGSPVRDGVTWSLTPRQSRVNSTEADPIIARVPILIGTNANEGTMMVEGVTSTADMLSEWGFDNTTIASMLAVYPLGADGDENARAATLVGEVDFTCPAKWVADDSTAVGIAAWRYFFNATFPSTENTGYGVYHGAELELVWGTYEAANATDFQVEVSAAMQKAWADFARDPTSGPGWDQAPAIGVFGGGARSGESDEGRKALQQVASNSTEETAIEWRCALFTALADTLVP